MPQTSLGDGLVFDELLPVRWTPGPSPDGLALARLNQDNHQLLGAESSLEEVSMPEALKDESPALIAELQRIEYKINILLRLSSELVVRNSSLPPAQPVRLSSRAMEWGGADAPAVGETGVVSVYINPALPQPLRIPATVSGERDEPQGRVALLAFGGLSNPVVELLDKLVFRHHRRLVAGTRGH